MIVVVLHIIIVLTIIITITEPIVIDINMKNDADDCLQQKMQL